MGFFKSLGSAVSKGAKSIVAPAVQVVSPEAAQVIRNNADVFAQAGAATDRFTADVAADTTAALEATADAFSEGGVVADAFSKDGAVTNFTQDYIPGGGFVTAIAHAAAGNEEYAQYAAVKGVSTTITTGFAVGGAVIGGPAAAVLTGAAGGALASAWEGGMKEYISPEVAGRSRMNDLTWENVGTSAAIGGAAGLAGWALAGAASSASKGISARLAPYADDMFANANPGIIARNADDAFFASTRGRSNAFIGGAARSRSNTFVRPMTWGERVGALRLRGMAAIGRAGGAMAPTLRTGAQYGKQAGGFYLKRAVVGAGGGMFQEVAKQTGGFTLARELIGVGAQKVGLGWRKVAAGAAGVTALLFGGFGLFGGGGSSSTTTVGALPVVTTSTTSSTTTTTTTPATTTTSSASTTTTQPPTTTTSSTSTTTTTKAPAPTTTTSTTIANAAPEIVSTSGTNPGPDSPASLSVAATDDALPSPPGALTYLWGFVSGPESVTIDSPTAASTSTSALTVCAGFYYFNVTVSDGELSTVSDDVEVYVPCG